MLVFGGVDDGGTPVIFPTIEGFRGRQGTGGWRWCDGAVSGRWAGPEGVEEEEAAVDGPRGRN
jgi:hypothetical protein